MISVTSVIKPLSQWTNSFPGLVLVLFDLTELDSVSDCILIGPLVIPGPSPAPNGVPSWLALLASLHRARKRGPLPDPGGSDGHPGAHPGGLREALVSRSCCAHALLIGEAMGYLSDTTDDCDSNVSNMRSGIPVMYDHTGVTLRWITWSGLWRSNEPLTEGSVYFGINWGTVTV